MQGHITRKKQLRHTAIMASRSLHTGVFLYFAILFKEFKKPRNNKFPHPPFPSSAPYTFIFAARTKLCLCELLPWRKPPVWCQWVLPSQCFCPRSKKDLTMIDIPYTCRQKGRERLFAILFRKQYRLHKLQRKHKYATLPNFSKAMRGSQVNCVNAAHLA